MRPFQTILFRTWLQNPIPSREVTLPHHRRTKASACPCEASWAKNKVYISIIINIKLYCLMKPKQWHQIIMIDEINIHKWAFRQPIPAIHSVVFQRHERKATNKEILSEELSTDGTMKTLIVRRWLLRVLYIRSYTTSLKLFNVRWLVIQVALIPDLKEQ